MNKYKVRLEPIFVVLVIFFVLKGLDFFVPLLFFGLLIYIILKKSPRIHTLLKEFNLTNPMDSVKLSETNEDKNPMKKRRFVYVVLALLALWLIIESIIVIDAGETGVYSLFGKVRDEELRSGIHIINPLARVDRMSIRTEQYTMSIAPNEGQIQGDDSIRSLTKEGLDVDVDFTSLYHINESDASEIYRTVGLDYVDKIIRPEIRGIIRDVISQYEAKELYSEKRQEASAKIESLLKDKVGPRGITIEQAVIRNIQLPGSLAKAIQDKLAAEQEAQRYDFVLDRERKEADRKRIEAEGQRDSQKIINESLSDAYLKYLYINQLKDRQGTIYVPISPSNGMPLFKGVE